MKLYSPNGKELTITCLMILTYLVKQLDINILKESHRALPLASFVILGNLFHQLESYFLSL